MPDDSSVETTHAAYISLLGMMSRMAERVAKLETGHEALKSDTEVIRHSIHAINGELQKVVIAEQSCLNSLSNLTVQVARLVDAAPAIARAIETFEGMRADLRVVIQEHGARVSLHDIGSKVLPWLAAICAGSAWAWEHFSLK